MTPVSGATQVTGIIGWPVEASLSPAIHNAAFAAAGLDWTYVAFPVRPGEVREAIEGMRALGVRGLNVTMPHKQSVIAHLDALSPAAERIGAVNTITAHGVRLEGSNTDGDGFLRFLARDASLTAKGTRAVVLGAGGAARGVATALADAGATVTVTARRAEQGSEVAALAGASSVGWDDRSNAVLDAELVVNATPLGRADDGSPVAAAALHEGQTIVDLIYHPESTELVRTAQSVGARAFNGLGMLIHQAALAFEAWTGVDAPLEAMAAAAR
jgi:shikimate dehydrogenase